jgi:hypothetical protein
VSVVARHTAGGIFLSTAAVRALLGDQLISPPLPVADGETDSSPAAYLAPLQRALIDDNKRHVNVVVCESDFRVPQATASRLSFPCC